MRLTDKARNLILEHEGFDQPSHWPGGQSGITLPIGYDLAHQTVEGFRADWGDLLPAEWIARLSAVVGISGEAAAKRAVEFKDIKITPAMAFPVFEKTVPRYFAMCRTAMPGFDNLPADAQGALFSLVFTRGVRMTDKYPIEERREMRGVRYAVKLGDLREIARQLRLMKRLWDGSQPPPYNAKQGGLVRRREDEAALIEAART